MQRPARTARCRCQRRAPSPGKADGPIPPPRTPPDLTRNGVLPRQVSFINTDLIAAPSSPGAMPPRPVASRVRLPALKEDSSANPDGSKGPVRRAVPMTGRLAFSPFGFFRSSHNARMPQTLADPAGGRTKVLDLLPAMRGSTFFPRRLSVSSRVKKGSPLPHPPLRSGPSAAGQIAPGSRSPSRLRWSWPQTKTKGE